MVHYSLSWAPDERPGQRAMRQAVDGSLKALGLENHQALVVAHGDRAHPHVHVIVNRVDPETGKAANMGRDRIKLSKWAEGYERKQGRIRCHQRQANNYAGRGGGNGSGAREEQGPPSPGAAGPDAQGDEGERSGSHLPGGLVEGRGAHPLGAGLEGARAGRRRTGAAAAAGLAGGLPAPPGAARQTGQSLPERVGPVADLERGGPPGVGLGGAIRGSAEVLERWERSLEQRQQQDRVRVAQGHTATVREIEHRIGKEYREELQGADERARLAARTQGFGYGYNHQVDEWSGRKWVDREEVEQRRELYGGPTYEQVLKERAERSARFEQSRRERARERPREPERSRDRDDGPSR